jgi:hypothetical protein
MIENTLAYVSKKESFYRNGSSCRAVAAAAAAAAVPFQNFSTFSPNEKIF